MPYLDHLPLVDVVEPAPGALLGVLDLSPIVDTNGDVVDHLITRAEGAGTTIVFGDLTTARWRRLAELDDAGAAFVRGLLARAAGTVPATVELHLFDRRMLVHLSPADDGSIRLVFARVDSPVPAAEPAPGAERIARLYRMMSVLTDGVAMYEPVRDADGTVVDFVCLEMSDADPLIPSYEQIGQRLLVLYPEMSANGTFDGYREALTSGEPWVPEPIVYRRHEQTYRYRVRATAIDDRLIVSWHDTLVAAGTDMTGPVGEPLTDRQVEILQAIAAGGSTSDIAAAQFLSPFTVRNEVRRILAKLGVRSRAEAVQVALKRHLIVVDEPHA